MKLKIIFNFNADRRHKNIPFIRKDRRRYVLMQDRLRELEEEDRVRSFLSGLHAIKNIKRVAKRVNETIAKS